MKKSIFFRKPKTNVKMPISHLNQQHTTQFSSFSIINKEVKLADKLSIINLSIPLMALKWLSEISTHKAYPSAQQMKTSTNYNLKQ
ncbi:hypothetical protein EUGRSUZ_D00633 [Eucalyptus grandis]|uniref:Uncharacterized protein n=2 Tax=Eucalyptus grandis TaxID=71139 RepID=A0ACC3L316_EUCGR|nr:hypothetical protein EUGRSUZ_D00633 [Eucalyptus grandis]